MPETTGVWSMLDDVSDAAQKLLDLYNQLVAAGIIKGEPIGELPLPYVTPPKPWYKSVYLPIGISLAAVGGAGVYYAAKKWK